MRKVTKKSLCLAATALVLTAGISAGTAMAYFTTYAEASGKATLSIPGFSETETTELFSNNTKHVVIHNTGTSECYVRVKAFAGGKYQNAIEYHYGEKVNIQPFLKDFKDKEKVTEFTIAEGEWEGPGEEGYYYFNGILQPGEHTQMLDIEVPLKGEDSFNVIVVQESTRVLYDEEGNPYAGWTQIVDTSESAEE